MSARCARSNRANQCQCSRARKCFSKGRGSISGEGISRCVGLESQLASAGNIPGEAFADTGGAELARRIAGVFAGAKAPAGATELPSSVLDFHELTPAEFADVKAFGASFDLSVCQPAMDLRFDVRLDGPEARPFEAVVFGRSLL